MPLDHVRYRTKTTSKGPVRLAFRGNTVVEAANLKTGATHTQAEFTKDRKPTRRRFHSVTRSR